MDFRVNRRSPAKTGLAYWSAARATNALRRVRLISTVGALVGLCAFFVLQLLPREADRALSARLAALPPVIDTASLQWLLVRARDSVRARRQALASLQAQQQRDSLFVVSVTDAAGVSRVVAGDTLRAQLAEQLRLARATPIVEGFLALAAAPALASDSLAQALADSLRDAERERGAFAILGGPDLRYRALQARVSALGEQLVERAVDRLRDEVSLLPLATLPVDTVLASAQIALRMASDSADELTTSIRRATEWNTSRVEQERVLRAAEAIRVPMLPMLLAVLTIATSTGYLAAFAVEWRHPRIADEAEVARLVQQAGVNATVVVQAHTATPPPRRRAADRTLPEVLRGDATAYVRLHQLLSAIGETVSVVGVMSEEANESAAVAVQLAAAAAAASRAALLIDADVVHRRVASTLGQPDGGGLAEAARGGRELASALVTVSTGRDTSMAFLSAGSTSTPHAQLAALAPDLQRLMQRHDVTVLALAHDATSWPTALSPHDVVFAVTPGFTRVAWLSEALRSATRGGQRVRSVLVAERPPATAVGVAREDRAFGSRLR